MEKYQLYIGALQDIPAGIEFSYYDSRRRYLFLLSDHKPEGKFKVVPENMYGELDPGERAWFNNACMVLNSRWVRAHEEEAANAANGFLALFEKELKKEAERAAEDGRSKGSGEGADPGGG